MRIRRLAPLAAVAAALAATASPANAGVLVESADTCIAESFDTVFSPWLDPANYTLAPGGQAESADGWASLGGGQIVDGNEPWHVVSADDSKSLQLRSGQRATTDTACVGIEYPTVRFFARSTGTGLLSSLQVSVTTETSLGLPVTLPVGTVLPTAGSWTPSLPMVLAPSLLPLLPGAKTPVRLHFEPVGSGTWQVDDVHIDPWRRG